jgi:hypothetical protein
LTTAAQSEDEISGWAAASAVWKQNWVLTRGELIALLGTAIRWPDGLSGFEIGMEGEGVLGDPLSICCAVEELSLYPPEFS